MDGADEKMASLKRAYADVLLNTAKESAARILAAESKAARCQRSLSETKEEAHGMLLRMKGIMDAKINEADIISVGQKRRIYELESQLKEAEDTIAILRSELKRVNSEMENKKSTGILSLDNDPNVENGKRDKPILLQCCVGSGNVDVVQASDFKNVSDKSQTSGSPRYGDYEKTSHLNSLQKPSQENNSSGNPDLVSLMITRKEPELYRNGCTQRIRALEQNTATEKGQINKQVLESVACKNEKPPDSSYVTAALMCSNAVDCSTVPSGTERKNENFKIDQTGNFQYGYSLRRPRTRSTRTSIASTPKKDTADHQNSPGNSNVELQTTNLNKSHPCLRSETMNPASQLLNHVNPLVSNDQKNEEQSFVCNKEQMASSSCLGMTNATSMGSPKDSNACESIGVPTKIIGERVLKYTFQRKRMRGSSTINCKDKQTDENNTGKRKSTDTTVIPAEYQSKHQRVESARESRRIAQVARQLISLSEKRW